MNLLWEYTRICLLVESTAVHALRNTGLKFFFFKRCCCFVGVKLEARASRLKTGFEQKTRTVVVEVARLARGFYSTNSFIKYRRVLRLPPFSLPPVLKQATIFLFLLPNRALGLFRSVLPAVGQSVDRDFDLDGLSYNMQWVVCWMLCWCIQLLTVISQSFQR